MIVILIFTIFFNIHLSCQEDHYHSNNDVKNKSESLKLLGVLVEKFCTNNNIEYTRYGGCGTCTLAVVIILIVIHFKKK